MSSQRAAQLVEAGVWLRLSGDHEGARRLFEQALKLDRGNVRARQLLESKPAPAPVKAAPPVPVEPESDPFRPSPPSSPNPMDGDWGRATGFDSMIIAPPPGGAQPNEGQLPPAATVPAFPEQPPPPQERPMPPPPGAELVPFELEPPSLPAGGPERFGVGLDALMPPGALEAPPEPGNTLVFPGAGPQSRNPTEAGSTLVFAAGPTADLLFDAQPPAPTGATGSSTMVFSGARSSGLPFEIEAEVSRGAPTSSTMVFGGSRDSLAAGAPEPSTTMVFGLSPGPGGDEPLGPPAASTMVFGLGASSGFPPRIAPAQPELGPPGPVESGQPLGLGEGPEPKTLVFGTIPRAALGLTPTSAEAPAPRATVPEPRPLGASPPSVAPVASAQAPALPLRLDPVLELEPLPAPPPSAPALALGATSAWDARSNPGINLSHVLQEKQGSAFSLFTPEPPRDERSPTQQKEEIQTLLRGARDLLALDDHSGAMDLITRAQELAPGDPDVAALRERSEDTLQVIFESKLGDLGRTPRVKLKDDEVIWLNLDHRAGFVLAQIDGSVTFEDIFSVSGMSRLDTARILAQLVEEGVISRG